MSQDKAKKKKSIIKEQTESYGDFDRREIIDYIEYELKPSPTFTHQQLVTRLWNLIYMTCHLAGEIIVAPMDVHLDEGNVFQPDLIFISNENRHIIKERIEGVPDLVVEILSPSTSSNDKIHKKAQYERFGVKEYWIVDPVHLIIDQFVLVNHKYQLHATYDELGAVTSELFSCISVDLNVLFKDIKRS